MGDVRNLSVQEIVAINVALIQKYSPGEHIGIQRQSLLESAVYRPQSSAFGEEAYPTLFAKASALFESIGQNHPFQNANERTAFSALVIFLDLNGFEFNMEAKQAEDFTVNMVEHHYTFEQLTEVTQNHSIRKKH